MPTDEVQGLRAFLMFLFGDFLFVDRSKGWAKYKIAWPTGDLEHLERVARAPAILAWLFKSSGHESMLPRPILGEVIERFLHIRMWSLELWEPIGFTQDEADICEEAVPVFLTCAHVIYMDMVEAYRPEGVLRQCGPCDQSLPLYSSMGATYNSSGLRGEYLSDIASWTAE
ncbi:hypothetical protein AMTR_s00165p00071670 [Amborella trichopoda]|uniref:Aminotransferase-like plant mobile domain-containing protein n=1 Tax=Amborella trichopoda TaxID=13333 RepID=W1PX91_AMBTC|nr:hypothetical protein AMTR_s00165p00071670 [Amborella trichopoda]